MNDQGTALFALSVAAAFVAGAGLGLAYLWGLWHTVRRQPALRYPGLWLLLSMLGRLALLLGGFFLVMAGSWQRLLACAAGFTLARLLVTRRMRPKATPPARAPAGKEQEP